LFSFIALYIPIFLWSAGFITLDLKASWWKCTMHRQSKNKALSNTARRTRIMLM
jgi:hypothetical protein